MRERIAIWAIVVCMMAALPSCYSFKEGQVDPNLQTVSIYNFTNISLNGNSAVTQELSEALRNRFLTQTRLRLVNRGGDIEFRGMVTQYNVQGTALTANQSTNQNRLTITVSVEFVNNVNDAESWPQNKSFTAFADFDSSRNFSDAEDELQEAIYAQLVEQIYNAALVKW